MPPTGGYDAQSLTVHIRCALLRYGAAHRHAADTSSAEHQEARILSVQYADIHACICILHVRVWIYCIDAVAVVGNR